MASEEGMEGEALSLFDVVLTREQTPGEGLTESFRCRLRFGEAGAETSVSVVPITVVAGKLLAAVPFLTWHRTPSRRILPRGGLSRPVLVEVAVPLEAEEGGVEDQAGVSVKAWIGFLSEELALAGVVGDPEEDTEIAEFGEEVGLAVHLPESALLAIADEHFSFVTAESGAPEPHRKAERAGKPKDSYDVRIGKLEEAFAEVQESLVGLPDLVKTVRESVARKSGPGPSGPAKSGAVIYPGLDPSAVAAARAAGFPEDQLAKLAAAAGKQPTLKEAPKRAQRPTNVLSESEEEEDAAALGIGGDGEQLGSQPAVERAVVQLAKIVATMQKEKSGKSGLEGILEKAEGGGSADSSGVQGGGSRGKAGAFKKLKAALQENPEWLYSNVEALMDEDFMLVRAAPGVSHQPTTTRAWLEHRSKLLHFQSSVRAAWLIGGIHDALKGGRVAEARARSALAILAYDQAALDNGNWQLAQELCLELAPPFSSFQGRKPPEVGEQAWSRLADERFLELALWRLKDKDAFVESRKRLSAPAKQPWQRGSYGESSGAGSPDGPGPKQEPKRKAKAKPKAAGSPGPSQEPQV